MNPSVIVFACLVLDLIAFACILPLFPAIIEHYGQLEEKDFLYTGMEKFCQFIQQVMGVQTSERLQSVFFGGVIGSLFCLLQFVSSPIFGALSDVVGRRPMLMISITGSLLSYIIWANASTFTGFVISRMVGGLSKASISICIAIMADIYPAEMIGKGMATIGGAFSVGFMVGPAVGVYLAQWKSYSVSAHQPFDVPAKFSAVLSAIQLLLVILLLPETLLCSQKTALLKNCFEKCSLYLKPTALFKFSAVSHASAALEVNKMKAYGWAYFIYLFLYSGLEFTLPFLTNQRFAFDSRKQGQMYVFIGVLMIIMQGGFVRRIAATKHHNFACYGIICTIPAYLTIGYTHRLEVFYIGLAFYAIASSLVVPCMTSCVSNLAPANVKGATIGVYRSLGALARALGPAVASLLFWLLGPTICYWFIGISLLIPLMMLSDMKEPKKSAKTTQ